MRRERAPGIADWDLRFASAPNLDAGDVVFTLVGNERRCLNSQQFECFRGRGRAWII